MVPEINFLDSNPAKIKVEGRFLWDFLQKGVPSAIPERHKNTRGCVQALVKRLVGGKALKRPPPLKGGLHIRFQVGLVEGATL